MVLTIILTVIGVAIGFAIAKWSALSPPPEPPPPPKFDLKKAEEEIRAYKNARGEAPDRSKRQKNIIPRLMKS